MVNKRYVDYAELIWEDFSYQIDNRQLKKRIREIMPYPRFTKVIINHFLSIHSSIPKEIPSGLHTIKDDDVLSRMKFISIGEDVQEYIRAIPDAMLTDDIKQSETYQITQMCALELLSLYDAWLKAIKGVQTLTPEEQLAANTMQALKASRKSNRSQLLTGGSSEGTDKEKKDNYDDDKSIDIEEADDEQTDDEFVRDYVDKEMKDAKVAESRNDDEEITDTTKADAEKTKEILAVSVYVISDLVVLSQIPEIPTVSSATTPPLPHSVSTISPILQQTTTPILTLPITTKAPPITTIAPVVTTIPDPLTAISQRVYVLEKDVQELKAVDHTTALLASLRSKIPSAVNAYLGSGLGDTLQKFLPKEVSDFATLVIQSTVKKALEKTPTALAKSSSQAQSSLKAAESLSEYQLENILFEKIEKSHSYLTHDKHQALYDSLFNSLCLDDVIARGQVDPEKILRKRDRDDEDPSAGPKRGKKTKRSRTKESEPSKKSSTTKESSKGKSHAKTFKSGKSVTAEEPVEEPAVEIASEDIKQTIDDVVNDADQPPYDTTQTKDKAPKYDWFKQPLQPLTPNPEWNIHRQAHLVSPVYTFLKGTCQSSIELEYNIEECYKALTDQLDCNYPEGDRCPYDLSKPLPLKVRPGRLTVPSEYFFNNDLEYLKASDPEKKYTTSITKTKAARYELVGIEDTIPNLWSVTKVGYNKDVERGIKHWGPKRQLFYITKINKLHGYGHLEEIVMRRVDRQKYKLKEGDFVNLHLNDIEDMLLLVAQHKLFNLEGSEIVDLDFLEISAKELYTPSFDPLRAVYKDLNKQKRVMRADELYKFSDGTLNQNRKDLPRDIPLDRIEVLRYDTKGVKVRKGIMQTKKELTLEQTQQGVSDEVLVNIDGVEERKRNVRIKGVKKEALHTLRQKPGQYICYQKH
ncbi:hypothetical protein Tco_0699823 [Tanacetum coccineum]